MEKFFVGQPYISGKEIEISERSFLDLSRSRDIVVQLLGFESLYNAFYSSTKEFEKYLLDETFEEYFPSMGRYESHFDVHLYFDQVRSNLNAKLLGLLSAARA